MSSYEDDSDDEKEEAGSEGERMRRDVDGMAILDIDDELADDEISLQIPGGYSLVSSAPAALAAAIVINRLCCNWVRAGSRGSSRDRLKRAHATSATSEFLRQRRQNAQRQAAFGKVLRGRGLGGGILGAAEALRGRPRN